MKRLSRHQSYGSQQIAIVSNCLLLVKSGHCILKPGKYTAEPTTGDHGHEMQLYTSYQKDAKESRSNGDSVQQGKTRK